MKSLDNIEKSVFSKEYVGYQMGIWRIYKWGSGWRAVHRDSHRMLWTKTLSGMSILLKKQFVGETKE